MADRLDFEIAVELEAGLITGHAGVPGLIEAFRQTGTAAVMDREIKLKSRKAPALLRSYSLSGEPSDGSCGIHAAGGTPPRPEAGWPFHKMTARHKRADAVADDLGDGKHRRSEAALGWRWRNPRRPSMALVPENQVRTGFPAGGTWIRTFGSPTDPLPFRDSQARLPSGFDLLTRNRWFESCSLQRGV